MPPSSPDSEDPRPDGSPSSTGRDETPDASTESPNAAVHDNSESPSRPRAPRPVVGIGASSGGVDALREFFAALPAESGMAFVVVQHLAPDVESNLPAIVARHTGMTVEAVTSGTAVQSNHVYVISPGHRLEISEGRLHVTRTEEAHEVSTVDRFFRSLAADQGENGVGIVLSGRGMDGTLGLRHIKHAGGVAFAQVSEEAEHESMPESAIQTGLVDLVAPAGKLAEKLVQFRDRAGTIHLPKTLDDLDADARSVLQEIFARLYRVTGHDFTGYKRGTVFRRVERRLQLSGAQSLEEYLRRLRNDEAETRALYKDLLIGVTSFFRNPEAFEALAEEGIPRLFEDTTGDEEVRVWVAGCATGEEAYSIAMLLLEHAETLDDPPEVRVFATDVDDDALRVGRTGRYPKSVAADLSEERLHRFFEPEGDHYRVNSELRDRIIFAKHNLLTAPPFSDVGLVSCRNLLIYLREEVQAHAFNRIHYGLREGGALFLGRSESSSHVSRLFTAVDRQNSLFRARSLSEEKQPVLPFATEDVSGKGGSGDVSLGSGSRDDVGGMDPRAAQMVGGAESAPDEGPSGVPVMEDVHSRVLMESVASVLVNENYEIVHLSGPADRYLAFQGGTPTVKVLPTVPASLRPDLRSALYQVFREGEPTCRSGLAAELDGERRLVMLRVEQVEGPRGERLAHIRMEDRPDPGERPDAGGDGEPQRTSDLEAELMRTRQQLQTTSEEYEAASEEMESANEELKALNEELQAKNDELETQKEKLQSLNEELETTNQELKAKIQEVREANSALENLMDATQIATLFLDRDLRIKRFSPRTTEAFNIRQEDVGRPLSDFTQRFAYEGLIEDARDALDELHTVEREIHRPAEVAEWETEAVQEKWFLVRIHPYRTVDNKIDGVVLTFVDITERKGAEKALRESKSELADELEATRQLQEVSTTLIGEEDVETIAEDLLDAAVEIMNADFGSVQFYDPNENILELAVHRGFSADAESAWAEVRPEASSVCAKALEIGDRVIVPDVEASEFIAGTDELDIFRQAGIRAVQTTPLISRSGDLLGMFSTHWMSTREIPERELNRLDVLARQGADLIDYQKTMDALRESQARLDAFVRATSEAVFRMSPDWSEMYALEGQDFVADTDEPLETWVEEYIPEEERPRLRAAIDEAIDTKSTFNLKHQIIQSDGSRGWVHARAVPILDESGEVVEWFGTSTDITEQRKLEEAVVGTSEKVRRDIGHELHDVLSSDLAALAMKADNLARTLRQGGASPEELVASTEGIAEGVRSAAEQSRSLSHVLIPAALQEEHLAAALDNLCREQGDLGTPTPTFEGDREEPRPESDETAMHLYRIAREAIANAQRHADTEHIWVRLGREDGRLVLTVRDEGVGLPETSDSDDGIGLQTMEYRANLIGATLQIESSEEEGTVVRCALPLSEVDRA